MSLNKKFDTVVYQGAGGEEAGAPVVVSVSLDASGNPAAPLPAGRAPDAQSVPVALSNEAIAAILPAKTTTNRSLGVTTSAQIAMPANTSRRGWKIRNDTTADIWINFTGSAGATAGGGNMKVVASSYLASEPGYVETGAMSIIGSAAGNVTILEFS